VLFESRVEPQSPLAGRALRDLGLPAKALVISVVRAGATIFPRADTRLEAGDTVMIMADPASEAALRTFLAGTSCLLPADAGTRQA
jgi:Trk K+ transport system NAD-binding subunit